MVIISQLRTILEKMSVNYDYIFKNSPKLIPNTSGMCNLNNESVQEYCNALKDIHGHELYHEVKYILDNTTYLSYPRMCCIMDDMFDKFKRYIGRKEYAIILIDVENYKSEHLWIQYLWGKIQKTNCIGIFHYKDSMIECDELIWIDDISYSGGNFQDIISREDIRGYNPKKHLNIILCGSTDNTSYIRLKDVPQSTIFSGLHLPLYQSRNNVIQRYYWISTGLPMIYLDYKIATIYSTYAPIYYGIVPSKSLSDDELNSEPIIHELYRINIMDTYPSRELLNSQQY